MNEYKIFVGNIVFKTSARGSEYTALKESGLFEEIEMVKAYKSHVDRFDSWLYRVKLNGKFELVMIERI